MCRRIRCEQCQKPSFAGCGKHVEVVLKDVALEDRCQCASEAKKAAGQACNDVSVSQPTAAQVALSTTQDIRPDAAAETTPVQGSPFSSPFSTRPVRRPSNRPSDVVPAGTSSAFSAAPPAACAIPAAPKPPRLSTPPAAPANETRPAPANANTSQTSPFSSPFSKRPSRRVA